MRCRNETPWILDPGRFLIRPERRRFMRGTGKGWFHGRMQMTQYPQTMTQKREEAKRHASGKAGRVAQKGGAPTSNKARGGKMAR